MPRPGPLSLPVLAAAVLTSSPTLWRALVEGTDPPGVALTRFLVSILVCWVGLSVLATLVGPPPRPKPAMRDRDDDDDGRDRSE